MDFIRRNLAMIIRIIVFVLLIGVIVFFVIRFLSNRQDTKNAQNAARSSQQENSEKSDEKNTNESNNSDKKPEDSSDTSVSNIPSGVADSNTGSANAPKPSGKVPEAGMGSSILWMTAILSFCTYTVTKKLSAQNSVR